MDEIFPKLQKFVKITHMSSMPQLANNGPAIWGVCVGLRMEVVTTNMSLRQGPGTQL